MRRPDDTRPAIATADHILDEMILPSAFRVFREKKFRDLSFFNKLPVLEHDRIFNELEVSGICLALFYLGIVKPYTKPEDFHFWREVEENLVGQFQNKLKYLGTDTNNTDLMGKLINMRFEEYQLLANTSRSTNDFMNPEFKTFSPATKQLAAIINATAVGTADHILRGEIKEGDPLIKYIMGWLFGLQKTTADFINSL